MAPIFGDDLHTSGLTLRDRIDFYSVDDIGQGNDKFRGILLNTVVSTYLSESTGC